MPEPKPNSICDVCGERPAEVFVTQTSAEHTRQFNYCENCAREEMGDLPFGNTPEANAMAMDQLMSLMFSSDSTPDNDGPPFDDTRDPFVDDGLSDKTSFDEDESPFGPSPIDEGAPWETETLEDVVRCSSCGTTWDTIRSDGRAGCAACYATFAERIAGVMERMQRGLQHSGKIPRAAQKRRIRLEQLRRRRDNQLQMLQSRLKNAVALEHFEEAAKLRDKIKIVGATIWNELQ